ncbi:MAG TPA: OsmC family protein [Longimicrobium sp.]|nr:OsmC family protein [Longimicrobium sp.]
MLKRRGSAVWNGTGAEGSGRVSTFSGALKDQPYSTSMRFQSEDGRAGTNPEELIAAAHAACFNMALSFQLSGAGFPPDELNTTAVLTMESEGVHWTITAVKLELRGKVPGVSEEQFQELAAAAKAGCPVSKVLNAEITLDAQLVS